MSDEIGREDTVLGTALARAIESQPIRATPFERSRLATRMADGGRSVLVPILAAAAAIVLGLALGAALLGQRGDDRPPVAASPTPAPSATATAATSPAPTAASLPLRVFFVRDLLPPVSAVIETTPASPLPATGGDAATAAARTKARLEALASASPPAGATNILASLRTKPTVNEVRIDGDLATVDYTVPDGNWGAAGSAGSFGLLQQLVYTASEEAGVRRVLLTENGGKRTIVDQMEIAAPMTREDTLFPYQNVKTEERVALEDDPRRNDATTRIDESVPGLTRFVIEMRATETPAEGFWSPRLAAELRANDLTGNGLERAKWILQVAVGGSRTSFDGYRVVEQGVGIQDLDRSPLRFVRLIQKGPADAGLAYELGLDDARPWRISLEPGQPGTMRLLVDIGGHSQAVSDSVAVYGPEPGDEVARTFTLTGTARAFEAHVAWRLRGSRGGELAGGELATGFVTASLGTSPVWGTFATEVKVPDGVTGVVTLEVFWPSPRDGADVGRVAVPLRVR